MERTSWDIKTGNTRPQEHLPVFNSGTIQHQFRGLGGGLVGVLVSQVHNFGDPVLYDEFSALVTGEQRDINSTAVHRPRCVSDGVQLGVTHCQTTLMDVFNNQ
jgi:hypothetical protein